MTEITKAELSITERINSMTEGNYVARVRERESGKETGPNQVNRRKTERETMRNKRDEVAYQVTER